MMMMMMMMMMVIKSPSCKGNFVDHPVTFCRRFADCGVLCLIYRESWHHRDGPAAQRLG